jgi:hypothetical protein
MSYMLQRDQLPEQKTAWSEVEHFVAATHDIRGLQLVPPPRKPRAHKKDLGARLKSILVGRFQARGLPAKEALFQAEVCLGLSRTDERQARHKIALVPNRQQA